jgi:hypothetical protein
MAPCLLNQWLPACSINGSLPALPQVPNTKSRAALGELSDRGLHDIFTAEFGAAGSPAFEKARENFIVSEAAYAVASYLLQVGGVQCHMMLHGGLLQHVHK